LFKIIDVDVDDCQSRGVGEKRQNYSALF